MPFSVFKKLDDEEKKELQDNDKCVKEFNDFEKCESENKDCADLLSILLKCNESPKLEKKEE